jgi:hypothetical protein
MLQGWTRPEATVTTRIRPALVENSLGRVEAGGVGVCCARMGTIRKRIRMKKAHFENECFIAASGEG